MVSLLLSYTSCSDEAFDVDTVNKQTILMFLPYSGSLTENLQINVDSICQGIKDKKGLNNSRVMVFFSENANRSTLYDLQYDETTKQVSRVPVKTYEGIDYTTADGIADILNEVKQQAEALNYAMIIGCHGSGWTYADDWTNYPTQAKSHLGNTAWQNSHDGAFQFGSDPEHPITRTFGGLPQSSAKSIDVTTLAEGIKKTGITMQYILFDACYMGNVETAYELKDVTNYLIASSSELMASGIPYRTVWSSLNSETPSYSGIVTSTVNYYKKSGQPYCNLAAIDCRQMDKLASIMKEINSKYSLASTVSLDSIQPLDGFSPHLFFDMGVYVDSLHLTGYQKEQFTNQLKTTIKAAASTDNVYTSLGMTTSNYIKVKSYCGLSISDPSEHSVATKGREKTGWWKATH